MPLYYVANSLSEAKQQYEADRACSPSHLEWQEDGLDLRIERSSLGNYCGYVRVPSMDKQRILDLSEQLRVHGGITFNDGEWVGFDCAHHGDYLPHLGGLRVWTLQAVQEETRELARQLRRLLQ